MCNQYNCKKKVTKEELKMNYNNNTVPSQFYRNSIVPNSYAGNMNMINNNTLLKGKPVSSLEEARATSIDFDGSIFFFPDLANKRIYTKQINMDGTATMQCYELSYSDQEELLADLIATYGEEIIFITNKIFKKIQKK